MRSAVVCALALTLTVFSFHLVAQSVPAPAADVRFRAIPDAKNIGEYMRRLSARPHHVGSAYDKDNAEWMLAKLKEWGWDARMESFTVLFPTPKERVVELVAPTSFKASLEEPAVAVDPTSNQKAEQLPPFNAYSIDGDVTAPLVYVNYGRPSDYEDLDERGGSSLFRFSHRGRSDRRGPTTSTRHHGYPTQRAPRWRRSGFGTVSQAWASLHFCDRTHRRRGAKAGRAGTTAWLVA